ncbi:MAG TPA: hypothetical protein VJT31_04160 [Rugosimonospora sp.]|nr:hypothetical protein [Rugosimonospora sp.]
MKRRSLKLAATSVAAAAAAVLAVQTPAFAANNRAACTVFPLIGHCTSSAIPANASGHFIWVGASLGVGTVVTGHWIVRDVGNNVVVGSGTIFPVFDVAQTIHGLYGSYRLELSCPGCSAGGEIHNY